MSGGCQPVTRRPISSRIHGRANAAAKRAADRSRRVRGGAAVALGATALLGAVAAVLLVWLIVFDWYDGADRGIGVFLALIGSGLIAYGGWRAAP